MSGWKWRRRKHALALSLFFFPPSSARNSGIDAFLKREAIRQAANFRKREEEEEDVWEPRLLIPGLICFFLYSMRFFFLYSPFSGARKSGRDDQAEESSGSVPPL